MGCLVVLLSAFAPRLAFLVLWLFFPTTVNAAFNTWIFPLLGLIFLPFTTLFYAIVVGALGPVTFWGWLFILFGFIMDLGAYAQTYQNKNMIPGQSSKPPSD